MTGRPLRKVSMANLTVVGVILAYLDAPPEFRRFGVNPFPPETGRRVHAALLDALFGNTSDLGALASAPTIHVGLSSTTPAQDGSNVTEPSGGSYAHGAERNAAGR